MSTDTPPADPFLTEYLQPIHDDVAELKNLIECELREAEHVLAFAGQMIALRRAHGTAITPTVEVDDVSDDELTETGRQCREHLKHPGLPEHLRELKALRLKLDVYAALMLRDTPGAEAPTP